MNYLRVNNWEEFQHYRDRSPPWIKLHRDLLNNYKFSCLQDASKLHLMLIWLLASQMDNRIPADSEFIKSRIGVKGNIDFNELINSGFLIDDSNALASCKQSAILETEAEAERETEDNSLRSLSGQKTEIVKKQVSRGTRLSPDWMLPSEWGHWALKLGMTREAILIEEEKFRDYWIAKTGSSATKADWQATWRNWIRKKLEG